MYCNRKVEEGTRIVQAFGCSEGQHLGNELKNTKYSLISFIPKNLAEQFSYPLNVYFLLVSIMQFFSVISPVHPLSTLLPLFFAFTLSATKEAIDDLKRWKEDKIFNGRIYSKLHKDSGLVNIASKDIQVGDVIRVNCDQDVPCDMVLLTTSSINNTCQIQTDKIDGETRVKSRHVEKGLLKCFSSEGNMKDALKNIKIECPLPENRHHSFVGVLTFYSQKFPMREKQFLPQASTLRACEWITGLVLYTSGDMANRSGDRVPLKRAKIDIRLSHYSAGVFFMQLMILASFGMSGAYLHSARSDLDVPWYIWLSVPARFFLLMAMMIPISFKVIIDVSKYLAAYFIKWDSLLTSSDENYERGASVSNTSIAEDLGCVRYIMTDKTGTLTDNHMNFHGICMPGQLIGMEKGILSDLSSIIRRISEIKDRPVVHDLLEHIALCHSIYLSRRNINECLNSDSHLHTDDFPSGTPEDACLVDACRKFGFVLLERLPSGQCILQTPSGVHNYMILHEFSFSSERRRMSVLVYDEQRKRLMLLTKGAEEEILARLCDSREKSDVVKSIEEFSRKALRVLVMGKRYISASEYANFLEKVEKYRFKEEGEELLWDELERELFLTGACALADTLQDGVPETVQTLRKGAGIKFWMLTGDKHQTAFEVAKLSNIVTADQIGFHFFATKNIESELNKLEKMLYNFCGEKNISLSIKGGNVLDLLLTHHSECLFSCAMQVSSVIIYRASPEQKALITLLVKKYSNEKTCSVLCVGDGGNDVKMLQVADVGIGIYGRESTYASRAADFSITRFRHLTRLLLIHGHYCNRRSSCIILYSFYKSMLISFAQLVFNIVLGFHEVSSFWDSVQLTMWNGLHTMPITFVALFDRAYPQDGLLSNPHLYRDLAKGKWFNPKIFFGYLFCGMLHATILILSTIWIYGEDIESPLLNSIAYLIAILLQILYLFFDTETFTVFHYLAAVCTICIYLLTTSFHGCFIPGFHLLRATSLLRYESTYTLLLVNLLPSVWMHCAIRLARR